MVPLTRQVPIAGLNIQLHRLPVKTVVNSFSRGDVHQLPPHAQRNAGGDSEGNHLFPRAFLQSGDRLTGYSRTAAAVRQGKVPQEAQMMSSYYKYQPIVAMRLRKAAFL